MYGKGANALLAPAAVQRHREECSRCLRLAISECFVMRPVEIVRTGEVHLRVLMGIGATDETVERFYKLPMRAAFHIGAGRTDRQPVSGCD